MKTTEQLEEIEAHKERLEWLLEDHPKWADGVLVDLPCKLRLIDQSREILKRHGIQHNVPVVAPPTLDSDLPKDVPGG